VSSAQGLRCGVEYNTDLFEASTIQRWLAQWQMLLESICRDPCKRIESFELVSKQEKEREQMQENEREKSMIKRFKGAKPQPVQLREETWVESGTLREGQMLPRLLRARRPDVDLVEWAGMNRPMLERELLKHGALLFRGFDMSNAVTFERFALVFCPQLYGENGEHVQAPESESGALYTPVFYAPEKKLLWHNENSFNANWPRKIMFHCARVAQEGGETPLADSREVYQRIDESIRQKFVEKQIMYIRSYGDGLGLSWQQVFRTQKPEEVEEVCRRGGIQWLWKEGGGLKTWQIRPGVLKHPETGDWVWWNQATHWHPACLDKEVRKSLEALYKEEDLPRNCCYGDGSKIEDDEMREICRVYEEVEESFAWEVGDIMLVDNILAAHARNPYRGERKLYVAMGGMMSLEQV
jgi:hypothetical protein